MVYLIEAWMSFLPDWLTLENPVNSFLQGLVGACGIYILHNLMRVHLFIKDIRDAAETNRKDRTSRTSGASGRLGEQLQFWFLTVVFSLVGSRVASLVVLEFCLRAISARVAGGPESQSSVQQFMVQSQFSLGCALTCTLYFLHEGAPQRLVCLLLAAGVSWLLAGLVARLRRHVRTLYPLHSAERYCGVCIGLLTHGRAIPSALSRALLLTFAVASVAAVTTINRHFLSATEALRFWTPLTICYTLLVVYMQDEQSRHPGGQAVLQTVVVRLGGLTVLMLTVGRWGDVLHILGCFLGEAGCLVPTLDLLDATPHDLSEEIPRNPTGRLPGNERRRAGTFPSPQSRNDGETTTQS